MLLEFSESTCPIFRATTPVNTIHPEPEIHETNIYDKRLRNIVHDYKHILKQRWAQCE